MRVTALLPLVCAIAAFILSMLCLFAGSKPNFMEDYAIVTLNTSTVGHNIIDTVPTATSSSNGPECSSLTSISAIKDCLQAAGDEIQNLTATVENELNTLLNNAADDLASTLGIHQWYSLHLMDMCEGSYAPNATASGASKNHTMTCTNRTAMYHFDPAKSLNESLANSPFADSSLAQALGYDKINLTTIHWPDELTDGIHALNALSSATFIFYVIGIAFAGLAILTSIVAFFLHGSRLVSFANWGIAGLSFLCLGIASAIVTAIMVKVVNLVNEHGNDAGVYAYRGSKFLALTWASVGLMLVATLAWIFEFCVGKRRQKREYTEKSHGKGWKSRFSRESTRT